ncbi:chemotaxis protein CheW [Luteimonas terricola]|uniref:Chemotaxis protein CheW n=1 Tax=Luteimonas terricola TaxID=645597 RepID=A0ABQ2ECH2_9GAMM|nr:chemotaxis protein CheW [Luteimonas terricola]GGK00126.1 chemotaxis protein CheW [Luteimonas terricola]
MNSPAIQDIRGVLIQVEGARLLLPNATIAEVLSYAEPEAVADAPDWLLGRIRWRGWQLPLASFSRLAGIADEVGGLGSKVVVLKALGGDSRLPYVALLTKGFPRLVTVSRDALVPDAGEGDVDGGAAGLPTGVLMRVLLNDEPALLPDVDAVETAIREALAA